MSTAPLILSALYLYPIKSAGRISLKRSSVGPHGLTHDRRWMVINPAGRLVTQREYPKMKLIQVSLEGDGLRVEAPGMPPLLVSMHPQGTVRHAEVWDDVMSGVSVSPEATQWFEAYLDEGCDLIYMADDIERWQEGKPHRSRLSFADGNPFHLITEASLANINSLIDRQVTAQEFRPNLVISGSDAYREDFWRRIQIGDVGFEVVESCSRCSMINVTDEAKMVAEPLRTLSRTRRVGKSVPFGQYLIQDTSRTGIVGELHIGSEVDVLEVGDTPNPFY